MFSTCRNTALPLCIALAALSGCQTKNSVPPLASSTQSSGESQTRKPPRTLLMQLRDLLENRNDRRWERKSLPITDPLREDDLAKVWGKVVRNSQVRAVSDNRIRVSADGQLLGDEGLAEQRFFIRAAAEALRKGYDGFSIVYVDYHSNATLPFQLAPDVSFASRGWIGTYEDFQDNKAEQNLFSTRGAKERKSMTGVVLLLNETESPKRPRFDARSIYKNFIQYYPG